MRRALAMALLAGVLAAHAQEPPETQPATPPPGEFAPTPETPTSAAAAESPAAAPRAAPQEAPAPAPRAPSPKPPPPKPPALTPAQPEHESELAVLRREVARLQAELDAERAAAVPPAEEGALAPPERAPWGWLVAVALAALAGGFVLGWRLLDRRIRRKYGGLRIY